MLCVNVTELQLSLASLIIEVKNGTLASQFESAPIVIVSGQVNVGGVTSITVTVVVHTSVFPASSVAVMVIMCSPNPTGVFARGH